MKLEELYAEIAKDFPIKKSDLAGEAIKTSELWPKYIVLWTQERLKLEQRQSGRATLVAIKREYYSGNADPEVYKQKPFNGKSVKTDAGLDRAILSDPDVIAYDEGTIIQKVKVDALKSAVDECKQRVYVIKDLVKMKIFEDGG
jgi:hypothetical protein